MKPTKSGGGDTVILHRTFVCSVLGGAVALMASFALNAATSGAESYPSRPGRLIVGSRMRRWKPSGEPSDFICNDSEWRV